MKIKSYAEKTDEGWVDKNGGFCETIDKLIEQVHNETGIHCVKGTAHLPKDYSIKTWGGARLKE